MSDEQQAKRLTDSELKMLETRLHVALIRAMDDSGWGKPDDIQLCEQILTAVDALFAEVRERRAADVPAPVPGVTYHCAVCGGTGDSYRTIRHSDHCRIEREG